MRSSFDKKKTYDKFDLLEYYEKVRFSGAYRAYIAMDWWPFFDWLATYGHLLNNLIIVIVAVYHSISLYMLFHMACVCFFYAQATIRLNRRALQNFRESGLQSQVDLKMASMITKNYKIGSFFEFLELRNNIWKFQFNVMLVVACLGFPTTVLQKYRVGLVADDPTAHKELIAKIDVVNFWIFFGGFWKDHRKVIQDEFYFPFLAMAAAMMIEKQAINWLIDRHGCTHAKVQKFTELDLRRQGILEGWGTPPPKYDIRRYKNHYYYHDFEALLSMFKESKQENEMKTKKAYDEDKAMRNFVPYKVAVRIKEAITFSVKLDGRCPDLHIAADKQVVDLLQKYDEAC